MNNLLFSILSFIVNAALGIIHFSPRPRHFLSGYNEPAYNELPDNVNNILFTKGIKFPFKVSFSGIFRGTPVLPFRFFDFNFTCKVH